MYLFKISMFENYSENQKIIVAFILFYIYFSEPITIVLFRGMKRMHVLAAQLKYKENTITWHANF